MNKAEEGRLRLLKRILGRGDRIELFYLVWLGFVALGQRVPATRKRFPEIARMMRRLLSASGRRNADL